MPWAELAGPLPRLIFSEEPTSRTNFLSAPVHSFQCANTPPTEPTTTTEHGVNSQPFIPSPPFSLC